MKKITRYSFSLIICGLLAACSATQIMEKRPEPQFSPDSQQLSVNQTTDPNTLHINYVLQIPANYAPKKAQVIMQTDLVNGNKSIPVSKVYINGRTFERIMWRRAKFDGKKADYSDGIMVVSENIPISISVNDIVDMEEWIPGAVLETTTTLRSCRNDIFMGKRIISTPVRYIPLAPGPVIIEREPAPEPIIRKEEGYVSLSYAINSYMINPDYGNNAAQLNKMTGLLNKILSDSLFMTDKIVVTGICSPDGSYAYNSDLARNRAGTVREYLISQLDVDPRLIQTDYIPEDWEGLRRLVEASDIGNKETILSIIDGTLGPDAKEAELKRLPQYQTLKTTMFPLLRQVKYEIYYSEKIEPR